MSKHKNWCDFPSGPCDCGATSNEFGGSSAYHRRKRREANDIHEDWCDWPSGPCDCGLHKQEQP